MSNKIEAVIFDWAGTTVDYGCFAPVEVFLEVFYHKNVSITLEEARGPMGMLKIDHIRTLTKVPRIATEWKRIHGCFPTEEDVVNMYEEFEPSLLKILPNYATPISGVLETVKVLRDMHLKIGSTTGYTDSMMKIVMPEAKKLGYHPDFCFTPDSLPAGRPAPWMIFQNAMKLGVFPMTHIVKVGDTKSDILEGVNAGCWSIGIVLGSNEMGLHQNEAEEMSEESLNKKIEEITERYYASGAHYVIQTIHELPALIKKINQCLAAGEGVHVIR
jgi:phosphonoacetaldehyde hydrolase